MPIVGTDNPNTGRHLCNPPYWFVRKWAVWQCPFCTALWRKEPPQYEDMDQWTMHPYSPPSPFKETRNG